MKYWVVIIVALFLAALILNARFADVPQEEQGARLKLASTELEIEVLLENLEIPWDMSWSSDGWIWFSEKRGVISRFEPDSGLLQRVHFIEEVHQSPDNSGLHALALHPDFPSVPYVYVHYAHSASESRLVRFRFNHRSMALDEKTILLDGLLAAISHIGSRIVFSPDGTKLFMTMGDGYQPHLAQDPYSTSGKILRMNLDGTVPEDNPFPGSLTWSFGHRNPQGLVIAGDGKMYSSEHGTGIDDELNLIEKGKNYGWPNVLGFCDLDEEKGFCSEHQVQEPFWVWSPTFGVAGIEFYDHEAIPEWQGSILVTSLKGRHRDHLGQRLQQVRMDSAGTGVLEVNDYLVKTYGRLREVMASPDGRVFIFTSNREHNSSKPKPHRERPGDDKLIMFRNPEYKK